jgi:hypothetical protein
LTVRIRGRGVFLARRNGFLYFPSIGRHIITYLLRLEMLRATRDAKLCIFRCKQSLGDVCNHCSTFNSSFCRPDVTALHSLYSSGRGALPNLQFHHVGAASFVIQLQMHDLHYRFPRYIKYFLEKLTQNSDQTNSQKMRRLSSCLYHLNETQARTFLSSSFQRCMRPEGI